MRGKLFREKAFPRTPFKKLYINKQDNVILKRMVCSYHIFVF